MNFPVVLVTGGAKRVGQAISRHFASQGWEVIIHYHHSKSEAEALSHDLRSSYPGRVFPLAQADLAHSESLSKLIAELPMGLKKLDALINNASVFEPGRLHETDQKLFREQMAVNFEAPFFMMQHFYNRYGSGAIVNLLDTRVVNNDSSYGAYALAKKALMHLTTMAAMEWAPNVRVNAVAPGPVLPPEGKDLSHLKNVIDATPLKKQVDLDNLCESVYFLATNDDITGQIVFCDGGAHLK